MWLQENLKLHMWLTFVAYIVFLLDSVAFRARAYEVQFSALPLPGSWSWINY